MVSDARNRIFQVLVFLCSLSEHLKKPNTSRDSVRVYWWDWIARRASEVHSAGGSEISHLASPSRAKPRCCTKASPNNQKCSLQQVDLLQRQTPRTGFPFKKVPSAKLPQSGVTENAKVWKRLKKVESAKGHLFSAQASTNSRNSQSAVDEGLRMITVAAVSESSPDLVFLLLLEAMVGLFRLTPRSASPVPCCLADFH